VLLAEFDGLHMPNANGDLPLLDDDPAKPNEPYFKHVDYIIDRAAEEGLVIGLLPTWGDKVTIKWGKGPEIFTPENAVIYGRWLGNRYKNRSNIIWILGDRNRKCAGFKSLAVRRSVFAKERSEGNALISYHPTEKKVGEFLYRTFGFVQYNPKRPLPKYPVYDKILPPGREHLPNPSDGEPIYEDHPFVSMRTARAVPMFRVRTGFLGCVRHTLSDIWQFYSRSNQ
jgi:hypothetical protein